MAMTMALNCNSTRNRIRRCEVFGEPPRIILIRPSSSTPVTAIRAMGRRKREKKDVMRLSYHHASYPPRLCGMQAEDNLRNIAGLRALHDMLYTSHYLYFHGEPPTRPSP